MVGFKGGGGYYAPIMCILLTILVVRATASVVLLGKNVSLSFDDIEANFAPTIKGSGERGVLYLAEPSGACSSLTNKVVELPSSPFALIIRGGCEFDEKVRNAQNAGFKAAIVYDNEDNDILVSMSGSSRGIKIHAIFVSKASGEVLKKYSGLTNMELWIIPTFENTTWSILTISFISLLAISAVLATCFFVRRQRIRHERPRAPHVREFHGMSSQLVKAMPSLIFSSVLEDNCTSRSCAICLEDYNVGEKLCVLPCRHKFHALCVDSWLTAWRTFCPVCKRDANTSAGDPPASERTPLLSSDPAPQSSTAGLSSFHSSAAASSPAIQIDPSPVQSLAAPQTHPQRSFCNSPPFCRSRSADLISMSPQRSRASHLLSSRSLGMPSSPPTNSRSGSPYVHGPSSGFPSYIPTL